MISPNSNEDIIPGFNDESSDYLGIRLKRVDGSSSSLLVELKGSIDAYNCNYVRRAVTRVMESGYRRVILGLRGVDYVSSAGVGTLLTLLRVLMENGGDLTILQPHPKVVTILELMHLETFFSCVDSLDDAVRSHARSVGASFPGKTRCPVCAIGLLAPKAGRFRCPKCKTVIQVTGNGQSALA